MIIQTDYIMKKKTYIAPTLTTFRVSAAQMVCTSYTAPSIPVDGGEDNGQEVEIAFYPVPSVQKRANLSRGGQGPNNKISISKCF